MSDEAIFGAAVLSPKRPVPPGLRDGRGDAAGERFSVYRNNVVVSLKEALATGFPVLGKLLGADTFDRMAAVFVRAQPPSTPVMMHYGADLPAFIDAFAPLRHIGYLPDVARLELALRESYHAADHAALDPAALAGLAEDALAVLRLTPAPSVRIVRSDWPIFDIWRYNMEPGAPKPRAQPQDVLITRREFDPVPYLLQPGAAECLEALAGGARLGDAVSAAMDANPGFDLEALLRRLLDEAALVQTDTKDP